MSVNENMNPTVPAREYSEEKGRFVAEQFADGETFRNLSSCFPEYLPPAMYIKQWRSEWPGFDALMRLAESALADVKLEDAGTVAENLKIPAAHAANQIKIKLTQAAALDSQVYGNKRIIAGDKDNPLLFGMVQDLSDDELMRIARGALVELPAQGPPTPPAVGTDGVLLREVRGIQKPTIKPAEDTVTTLTGVDPGF